MSSSSRSLRSPSGAGTGWSAGWPPSSGRHDSRCSRRAHTSRSPTPTTCRRRRSRWTLVGAHPTRSIIVGTRLVGYRVTWLRLSQLGPSFGARRRWSGPVRLSGTNRPGGRGRGSLGTRRAREEPGGARATSVVDFASRRGGTQGTSRRIPAAVTMT